MAPRSRVATFSRKKKQGTMSLWGLEGGVLGFGRESGVLETEKFMMTFGASLYLSTVERVRPQPEKLLCGH